ncbi:MAG: hypothetical protein N3A57_06485, partial [Negativicutes bacterium]|nr:hypothetical protein [Negativicutes bacterium]
MRNSRLLDKDSIYLFHQGTNYRSYQFMGAHVEEVKKLKGVRFNVWAPNAAAVSIVGEFNDWRGA